MPNGRIHHLEIWVEDYDRARVSLGWMLEQLGYTLGNEWANGGSWQGPGEYIVLESGPDVRGGHDRRRAGLNHLAFTCGGPAEVTALAEAAQGHGWTFMFADRYPFAGGPSHFAAYVENADGFEIELVAT